MTRLIRSGLLMLWVLPASTLAGEGLVSIDFVETGRLAATYMRAAVAGEPAQTFTTNHQLPPP